MKSEEFLTTLRGSTFGKIMGFWSNEMCFTQAIYSHIASYKQETSETCHLFFSCQSQSWGFTSRSTARVILGQVLSIVTCGTRTHRGDSLSLDAKLANH